MGAKPPPSPPFACLTGLDFILFFIVACGLYGFCRFVYTAPGIGVSLVAPAFHRLSVKYQNVSVFSALPLGLGIIVALLVYGVLQERIVTRPYYDSDGNEKYFKFSIFMVICNRTAAACYSFIMIKLSGESIRGQVPPYKYAAVSFANVVATTLVAVVMTLTLRRCQYEALKYVNFAMQTLGKSAKMLPVMLWGKFINHKTYKSQDYIIVTLVTIGITIFGCGGDISSSASDGKGYGSQIIGIALIAGYCMFDSFSSTFQEKLFKGVTTTHYNQMFWVNVWSSILSIFGMLMYGTDAFWKAISFVQQHPSIMGDVLTLSVAQVTAQNFIFRTVKEFGALMLAGFMNTRQFLSVIISTVKFGHAVSLLQWVGVALIFGALYGKVYLGQQAKKSSAETELIAPKAQDAVSPEETKGLIQERAPEDSEPKV